VKSEEVKSKIDKAQKNPVDFGGDGGNRTRVQKFIPATFYMLILSFEIPLH